MHPNACQLITIHMKYPDDFQFTHLQHLIKGIISPRCLFHKLIWNVSPTARLNEMINYSRNSKTLRLYFLLR